MGKPPRLFPKTGYHPEPALQQKTEERERDQCHSDTELTKTNVVSSVSQSDLSNAVDLFVHFRPMMVALLTGARHGEGHARRVPRADARHLAQTFVCLALQLTRVPTRRHSCQHHHKQTS